MNRIYIKTYGCQMNQSDSERVASLLESYGYRIVYCPDEADVVLINTCSVRQLAEEKVYSKLGELKQFKENKGLKIGVIGCMAQRLGEKLLGRAPYVDMVCGTYRFGKLPEYVNKVLEEPGKIIDVDTTEERVDAVFSNTKVTVFVPVMRGCNNRCSYCVVPYVRGPERSRDVEEIIAEIRELVKYGVKEITLLGQNINSYKGKKGKETVGFVELLKEINAIDGLKRIRFVTSHPKDASEEMFYAIAELDKVCEYLHLPIQSGSDKILQLMNRGYTRSKYLDLIQKLRKIVPTISLSADIIAGFPGETDEDFNDTVNVVREVQYDSLFVFKYSPREGTPAFNLKDDVPSDVKKERQNLLNRIQNEISLEKNKSFAGKRLEVLVEGISKKNPNRLTGRTRCNRVVNFEGTERLVGELVQVEIVDATAHSLYGVTNVERK